jgi:hypothetical protein
MDCENVPRLYFKGGAWKAERLPASRKSLGKSEDQRGGEDKSITDDIRRRRRLPRTLQKKQNLVLTSKFTITRNFA